MPMNNITCNGNKLKRIYVNGKLVQDIKYKNKQVLGFRRTDQLEETAFDVTGTNWANTNSNLNNTFKVILGGTSRMTTKYICKGFTYTFTLPGSTGAILNSKFGINNLFEISIEYYKTPTGGLTTINGQSFQGYPSSIVCKFDEGMVYFNGYKDAGGEQSFTYSFNVKNESGQDITDIENRYGYVEITSDGSETTEIRGVTGYFEVCDQYPWGVWYE